MSAVTELINQLCPNGVEYKTLGEVARIERGNGLAKSDFVDSGIPCIHYGQLYTRFDTVATNALTCVSTATAATLKRLHQSDVLMAVTSENIEDVCKCIAWLGDGDVVVGGHTAIIRHSLNPKYLAYWFRTYEFFVQKRKLAHGTKVIEVTPSCLTDVMLPVPPLHIQQEIVRRLDAMTGLIDDLEKELAARQKQYEWVREETFKQLEAEGVERKKLGEIVEIIRGDRITKRQISDVGDYPVISGGTTPMGYYSQYNRDSDSITIAQYGTAGFVDWQTKRFWANDVCYCLQLGGNVDGRFLFFSLKQIQDQIFRLRTNAVPACLPRERLAGVEVFLPSVPIQQKIVRRLDEMTELIAGIEKEIALRKQQYEYCREKLLTFTRAG